MSDIIKHLVFAFTVPFRRRANRWESFTFCLDYWWKDVVGSRVRGKPHFKIIAHRHCGLP